MASVLALESPVWFLFFRGEIQFNHDPIEGFVVGEHEVTVDKMVNPFHQEENDSGQDIEKKIIFRMIQKKEAESRQGEREECETGDFQGPDDDAPQPLRAGGIEEGNIRIIRKIDIDHHEGVGDAE